MSQYSVLLVDDEEDVIHVIMKKLDWEAMGFKIVGYAQNGIEALEMAEEQQIDVVMTDIKMPYMDGLTLCKQLKEQYHDIKVIIFSGFDEFEYAKEAIKIEAEEYILKPINSVELQEVFERIKDNLDKERDEKQNVEHLKKYYVESLPVLQENFLTSLVTGEIPKNRIERYALNYQIDLSGKYYSVTVLQLSADKDTGGNSTMNPLLLSMAVKRLVEEQMKVDWKIYTASYLRDIVILTQLDNREDIARYTDEMDKFCKMARKVCLATVTAGVGYICEKPEELLISYEGAKNAISYGVLYGTGKAINIAEVDPEGKADFAWEEDYIRNFMLNMKFGKDEMMEQPVSDFINGIRELKLSFQQYHVLVLKILTEMYRFCGNNQLNVEEVFGANMEAYAQVLQMDTIEDLEQWMLEKSNTIQSLLRKEKTDSFKSFVDKAVEYVENHYGDQELTIDVMCDYLGVSSAYFSTVFKKETGKTFIHYLTDYRMEKAVELLMSTSEKTYVIAEKIGYSDPNYFSYVFKKKFGVSPSKYKSINIGN